jgi:protein phosphatase
MCPVARDITGCSGGLTTAQYTKYPTAETDGSATFDSLQVLFAGRSERGPRALNQDSYVCDPALGLFIVADGMGGHKAGEVASRMAVDAVVDFVRASARSRDITWPYPYDPTQSKGVNRLTVGLRLANRKVYESGRNDLHLLGMGTTIVAALVDRKQLVIAHVGDSRAYRLRGSGLEAMTKDHTWLAAMVAAEPNTRTDDHPMRHVLTSGIGMREDVTPAVTEHAIESGDCWLLCSDGVHGYLAESRLPAILALPSADDAATGAVREALDGGGSDNATAVVLRFV